MTQPNTGQVTVTIHKSAAIAFISGGDYGPGKSAEGGGINYKWSLSINELEPVEKNQFVVIQTLGLAMSTIGGVAQSSCQSATFVGAGDYDGDSISIGGTGKYVSTGQLQTHGAGIDISAINENKPSFAALSSLPAGTFAATPENGITKRNLTLNILE